MPKSSSEEKPADDFTAFFMNKTKKIIDALDHHPTYEPTDTMAHYKMDSFEKVSKDAVERKQTKSCESDALPTALLKKSLKGSINIITMIMNMSLGNAVFTLKWKKSIIRPLLKKLGLHLILSNYKPVSNLPFLLIVLELSVLRQFNNHCR